MRGERYDLSPAQVSSRGYSILVMNGMNGGSGMGRQTVARNIIRGHDLKYLQERERIITHMMLLQETVLRLIQSHKIFITCE